MCNCLRGRSFVPGLKFNAASKSDTLSVNLKRSLVKLRDVDSRARYALVSGEGEVLSYSSSNGAAVHIKPDPLAFGTPTINSFFHSKDEFDLDQPTEGFSSIADAIEDIRQGKVRKFSLY